MDDLNHFQLHSITVPTESHHYTPEVSYKEEITHVVTYHWFKHEFRESSFRDMSLIIQIDDGSQVTTTPDKHILHGYKTYPPHMRSTLKCASKIKHSTIGFGYILIPTTQPGIAAFVRCSYTPSMPTTVISPITTCDITWSDTVERK